MKSTNNILYILLFTLLSYLGYAQCGPGTPVYTANLVGIPNGTVITPNIPRNDTCCGATAPDKCIEIIVLLDANAMGINFEVYGALPPGALFYQIGCGPPISVGSPICLNGPGPHSLTFCKPGNNINSYGIISIPAPVVPDSVLVRNGCTATLATSGFSVPTITWNSIAPGLPGAYNSYLSCTTGCGTVVATPSGTPPAYVDYLVGGFAVAPCQANYYQDTVRVYFYSDLVAAITPSNPTICFGNNTALLTATVSGGLSPYTYSWSSGATSSAVTVGPGTYSVFVSDKTACPPTLATAIVSQFTLPITANPGPAQTLCKLSPTVTLNGTVVSASGGIWSGGTGSFVPSNTVLSTSYVPSLLDLSTGSVQLVLNTTGNQGCPPGSGSVAISFQDPSFVNAGSDKTVCANNNVAQFTATASGFPSTLTWAGSGSGTLSSGSGISITYTPSLADITSSIVSLVVTATNNGFCPAATDTVQLVITPRPVVNAGPDQLICSTQLVPLSGSVTVATSTGSWTSTGDGTFTPSAAALNASYTPGPNDVNSGTVALVLSSTNNGNCLTERDTLKLTIRKNPLVNAGANQLICSSPGTLVLTGSVSGGTATLQWSSAGSGTFLSGTTASTTSYAFSPGDITTGSVIFTLSSTNTGPCPVSTDTVKINSRALATVFSGSNQVVCSSQNTIALNGTIVGPSTTGAWSSSGTGVFVPGNTLTTTAYSLTTTDINNGTVTFTLVSTNNGVCPAVSDTVRMRVVRLASVSAGPNNNVCAINTSVVLSGTVSGGTNTGAWAGNGTGSFSPSPTALTVNYTLSAADIAAGQVIFTLSSTNNGPCPAVLDTVQINIRSLATVSSGANQVVCASQSNINLQGQVIGSAGTGSWTSNGTGAFTPGASALTTGYSFSQTDINSGSVTFTLSSTNNGACPVVRDSVKIVIVKPATVTAGPDVSMCSSQGTVQITGTVTGVSGSGTWNSGGDGSLLNANTNLLNGYTLGTTDIAIGTVYLVLSSNNNGPCPAANDTLVINIQQPAQVTAGSNQTICSSTATVSLSGYVSGGPFGASWSSTGGGSFVSGANQLNAVYALSLSDQSAGSLIFTIFSTNNGNCPVISSTLAVVVKKAAIVTAGASATICSNQTTFNLNGSVLGSTSTGFWSSSGSGNFIPSANNLNAVYSFAAGDITTGSVLLVLTSSNNDVCPPSSDSLRVKIIRQPSLVIQLDSTICSKQFPYRLNASVSGDVGKYLWVSSGTGTFSPNDANPTDYFFTAQDVTTGTVALSLNVLNNGPCADASVSSKLVLLPSAKAVFSASSYTLFSPSEQVIFTNNSLNADTYFWNFGDGNYSPLANPKHLYANVGYYTVTLIADNKYDCSDTAQTRITVTSDVEFPNVFTPNPSGSNGGVYSTKDYSNDVFFPYTAGVVEYDLAIFNRWGEIIFRSNKVEIGWDGYFNGKLCQQDTYVWKANIKFFDGKTYNKTGSVTLLR